MGKLGGPAVTMPEIARLAGRVIDIRIDQLKWYSMHPRITVILPTYNWSSALRLAMTSLTAQSFTNFEALVVGDGCTDDSEAVVQSFRDPRVTWHNLPERIGSQSGPNNFALQRATGDYIAYLGHDDIWHPDHLSLLLEILQQQKADLATSACVMYGPPGSGVRGLSGVFVKGEYRKQDFFPPSAWMHRRELVERIGLWRLPQDITAPVDCDFLDRVRESGAAIVSSKRLTVFKFNAAWRRDSYLRKDAGEQASILERLRANPSGCVESELIGMLQAFRESNLFDTQMPTDPTLPAGHYFQINNRIRGLASPDLATIHQAMLILPDDQPQGLEWHALEHSPEHGAIRWSGPSPESWMVLPFATPSSFLLRIRLLNWLNVPVEHEVKVYVNDQLINMECEPSVSPAVTLRSINPISDHSGKALRIRLEVAKLRSLYFDTDGQSSDRRWLGVCLNWVEIVPH